MHAIVKHAFVAIALVGASFLAVPASQAASTVNVSLTDEGAAKEMAMGLGMNMGGDMTKATMFVKIDKNSVKAGKVTFNVVNKSKDTVHELIVGRIANTTAQMKYVASDAKVDEEGSDHLGEVSELDPGKSGALILTLAPGTYILYCNVANHYMAGMWTLLTVK
jgi:uncharacterized cupredoxin-like copper-binding protein